MQSIIQAARRNLADTERLVIISTIQVTCSGVAPLLSIKHSGASIKLDQEESKSFAIFMAPFYKILLYY